MNRVAYFQELLADEGYRPSVDEDGDIVFKVEGERVILFSDSDDEQYVRLMMIYTLAEETDIERSLAVVNYMNKRMKAVKFSVDGSGDSVAFSLEAFYAEPEHFKPLLGRTIRMVKTASDEYFAKLRSGEDVEDEI